MSSPIISIENLGKRYTLRHQASGGPRYRRLSEELVAAVRRPFRAMLASGRAPSPPAAFAREEFWALRNVSFEVRQGDVIGVIGRNGAGKSTLLKVLSRITEPSEGRVRIRGRVASLLEVGTGFHPELTGRENIFLNGAILGMTRAEIRSKFDEIVAFAEVEKFLDTPVKHFSSGMYVRLAFAVAAHLEPDILVVDEVLAVGDAEFQKKCLGKMQDVSKHGRTVLFVSHNMAVIQALCPSSVVLQRGRICFAGPTREAVSQYMATGGHATALERPPHQDGRPTLTKVAISRVECRETTSIALEVTISSRLRQQCSLEIILFDSLGMPVGLASCGLLDPAQQLRIVEGPQRFACCMELPRLARATYSLILQLAVPMVEVLDSTGDRVTFELRPEPLPRHERALEARWGYGTLEIPLHVKCVAP